MQLSSPYLDWTLTFSENFLIQRQTGEALEGDNVSSHNYIHAGTDSANMTSTMKEYLGMLNEQSERFTNNLAFFLSLGFH